MTIFTNLAKLVESGVVISLTLRNAKDGKLQLELLPQAEAGKTGLSIPPKAFIATPAELDEKMPDFLANYAGQATSLNEQIQQAKVALEAAERAVKDKQEADRKELASKSSKSKSVPGTQKVDKSGASGFHDDDELGDNEDSGSAALANAGESSGSQGTAKVGEKQAEDSLFSGLGS